MKSIHSSGSIFLMELILNLLLFCVMLAIGLQLFLQAHTLTARTKELHQAVTACESVASLFKSGDGTLDGLSADIADSTHQNGWIRIYLDEDFAFCGKADEVYYMTAKLYSGGEDELSTLRITCCTKDGAEIYTLTACRYKAKEVS